VLIVSMEHVAGWLVILVAAADAVRSAGRLAGGAIRGVRFTAVPAPVWSELLLSPVLLSLGSHLLGHGGPRWLGWPVLALCAASLALEVVHGVAGRNAARASGPADRGSPEPLAVPDVAALIERIKTAEFGTTRFEGGYDEEEVDDFLGKLIAGLSECGLLDQAEVRGVTFAPTRLRPGYIQREVDDFLDEVIARATR
jgi:DivIVA domain-containing protein